MLQQWGRWVVLMLLAVASGKALAQTTGLYPLPALRIRLGNNPYANLLDYAKESCVKVSGRRPCYIPIAEGDHLSLVTTDRFPAGQLNVNVVVPGYAVATISITLPSEKKQIELVLERLPWQLDVIELHAQQKVAPALSGRQDLSLHQMESIRGLPLADALTQLPGVTTFNTGPNIAKPMIHGMQGNRLVTMAYGVRLEGQQWGNEHAPEVDPYLATNIAVVRGANAVQYGPDALGGAIILEPDALRFGEPLAARFHLDGFSNGRGGATAAIVNGSLGEHWAYRVHASARRLGNVAVPGSYLTNTGVAEWNGSAALGYRRGKWDAEVFYSRYENKVGILRAAHIGNQNDLMRWLANPDTVPQGTFSYAIGRPYQHITHDMVRARASWQVNLRTKLQLQASQQLNQRQEYDIHLPRRAGAQDQPQLSFQLQTQSGEAVLNRYITENLDGKLGVQVQRQSNEMDGRQLIPNFRQVTYGMFATQTLTLKQYVLEAGARLDRRQLQVYRWENNVLDQPRFAFQNMSLNAGISRDLGKTRVELRGARAWRPSTVNELFSNGVHHATATYERGDRTLAAERLWMVDASATYTGERFTAFATVYRNWFDNYIYQIPRYPETVLTIRGAFPLFDFVQRAAVIQGVDAQTKYQLTTHLDLTAQGSLVRGQERSGEWLVFMPADRVRLGAQYHTNARRNLQDERWLGLGVQQVARQTRLPANTDFAPAPPAYTLVDAEVGATFGPLTALVRVTNLANQRYRDYLNRLRYYAPDAGRNVSLHLTYVLAPKRRLSF